jgi:hypothetical protein
MISDLEKSGYKPEMGLRQSFWYCAFGYPHNTSNFILIIVRK